MLSEYITSAIATLLVVADPMRGDASSMEWAMAWIGKNDSPKGKVSAMDMMADCPADAKPGTSKPNVMWAGTPYAYLMAPVEWM